MKKVNILAFPGTNCQIETARAIRRAGFESSVLRWNDDPEAIKSSDGLVVPGGFSFEDRGRSGVVAAADPVANILRDLAEEGRPILGICNGAQILVEIGLVPGFDPGKIELSLARNRRQDKSGILGSGFYHGFVTIKSHGSKCAWTNFSGTIRLPVAHAEGRFLAFAEITAAIQEYGLDCLKYCDQSGEENPHFPVNPNGSILNMAAVCNPEGNVMAMMPHPERVPEGQKIFTSLHAFFADSKNGSSEPKKAVFSSPKLQVTASPNHPLEMYIRMKITDNTEKTIENTARRLMKRPQLSLERRLFWGLSGKFDPRETLEKLIASEEFFNENKESAIFKVDGEYVVPDKGKLVTLSGYPPKNTFLVSESDDILAQEKEEILRKHLGLDVKIHSGVAWSFSDNIAVDEITGSTLFANPVSWQLAKVG